MKRIIFMGTPTFAAHILAQLLEADQKIYEIIAVVSQPDKTVGRKRMLSATPVKEVARAHNLPVLQPVNIRDAYDELVNLQPDLIITAAYGQIVPKHILDLPVDKCINVHGSLLPKYRGGAPIQHAIMNGETQTGITIIYMVEKMDAGAMLARVSVPILADDTLESIFNKLKAVGAELLIKILPALFNNEITPVSQDDTKVTYAPTIKKADCKIDWTQDASTIFNQVRGLYPAPAAFTVLNGKQIKFYHVIAIDQETRTTPGMIIKADKMNCHVATGNGVIALVDLQLSGKKRQSIAEFMGGSGRKLFLEGVQFEN